MLSTWAIRSLAGFASAITARSFAAATISIRQSRSLPCSPAAATAVASGTATLEAALLGTPLVIVYKESALNWHTLGSLITTEHFGLVNLIAQRRLATELIQDQFTGETLSKELLSLLESQRNVQMRSELAEVMKKLGEPGASMRAAQAVMRFIDRGSAKHRRD